MYMLYMHVCNYLLDIVVIFVRNLYIFLYYLILVLSIGLQLQSRKMVRWNGYTVLYPICLLT